MHKIVAGIANRSYGIHVAKMAGMPESVVARAESVLASLEEHNAKLRQDLPDKSNDKVQVHTKVSQPELKKQLNLFG